MSRAYEWRWLQRQKDHRAIDQRVVGLVPITPFSTLFLWPLDGLQPLAAKHIWLLLQMFGLVAIAGVLRAITGQPLRRIAMLIVICFPIYRNFLYGQFYILLLGMIVGGCWAYQRGHSKLAGTLVALATATKVFPVIFVLYFIRKRDWQALCAAMLTGAAAALISVHVFGWQMHLVYLREVLPWTLRGEALPPYMLAGSSISTLLHRLFIYEPQWNAHPWCPAPAMVAILQPLLQAVILAPALLLVRRGVRSRLQIAMEWSAVLTASLAISTVPASYNFALLLLPIAVLCSYLLPHRRLAALGVVLLYVGIGYPGWNAANVDGLRALLHVPRLYLVLAFTLVLYRALGLRLRWRRGVAREDLIWCGALALVVSSSIVSGLLRQDGLYDDYAYRIPADAGVFLAGSPVEWKGVVSSVSLVAEGYHIWPHAPGSALDEGNARLGFDDLALTSDGTTAWTEEVSTRSRLVSSDVGGPGSIEEAESPVLAADGRHLAYLREEGGGYRLFTRALMSPELAEVATTPKEMDVDGATFLPDGSLIVSAFAKERSYQLFHVRIGAEPQQLKLGKARYPAVSPDGHWLAYSHFEAGVWNLWLMDRGTGSTRRITHAACNQTDASWERDSKTLLYASDCGRSLWFTAICRRRVIP